MIKRYTQFVTENQINGFNSLGEWIESLMNDEYIRNIVIRYTKNSDPSLRIPNVINLLDSKTQSEIKGQVDRYLESGIEEKDPYVLTSTETQELLESVEEVTVAGKSIFNSFLKSLTALGKKESNPDFENCPDNFLFFYLYKGLNYNDVKQIFTRFKSLSRYTSLLDYQHNELNLYFGIKCDGQFEYGVSYDKLLPIGQFKLSQSVIKWICQLESKSAYSLKKELVNLTYSDIITLGQIKFDMSQFNPGYYEKKTYPKIEDRVISFGYFGVGRWDNGKLDEGEFLNIKNNFTTYLLSKRWSGKVLISVKPISFWVYLNIKLK